MTGIEGGTAVALKLGVSVVTRVAPAGFALVRSWLRGKELLVIGQPRAGKTTFVDYLQHGLFEDEKDTEKSHDLSATPRFNVKLGRDSALELTVKTAVDIPGQWGAVKHADVAFDRNPHAILVFLDATPPGKQVTDESEIDPEIWMRNFCQRLETHWRTDDRKRSRLRALTIAVNKVDRIPPENVPVLRKRLRSIADSELHDAKGRMKDAVAIVGTCLVTNSDGAKLIDSAIAQLAKQLAK